MENVKWEQIQKYLLGFVVINPEPRLKVIITDVQPNTHKYTTTIEVKTNLGLVNIVFKICNFWGMVNPLGECYLNGVKIKTDTIAPYQYDKKTCAMFEITKQLLTL